MGSGMTKFMIGNDTPSVFSKSNNLYVRYMLVLVSFLVRCILQKHIYLQVPTETTLERDRENRHKQLIKYRANNMNRIPFTE